MMGHLREFLVRAAKSPGHGRLYLERTATRPADFALLHWATPPTIQQRRAGGDLRLFGFPSLSNASQPCNRGAGMLPGQLFHFGEALRKPSRVARHATLKLAVRQPPLRCPALRRKRHDDLGHAEALRGSRSPRSTASSATLIAPSWISFRPSSNAWDPLRGGASGGATIRRSRVSFTGIERIAALKMRCSCRQYRDQIG